LVASFWLCYQLRSDFQMTARNSEEFRRCLPWMVLPQIVLLFWRGQLRGLVSYFSIPEMRRTVAALGAAFVLQIGFCRVFETSRAPGRSIFLMDVLLSFFALCGVRMAFRLLRERSSTSEPKSVARVWRVAIIGTGELATNLALDFARSHSPARRVVAFFDDDPNTWQKRPHDIPVFGMPECLLNPEWLKKIDEVIIALPEENAARLGQIEELLKGSRLKVSLAPRWSVPAPEN
jgi:FlaA1/EpsC-like NDP-sugar epimerase